MLHSLFDIAFRYPRGDRFSVALSHRNDDSESVLWCNVCDMHKIAERLRSVCLFVCVMFVHESKFRLIISRVGSVGARTFQSRQATLSDKRTNKSLVLCYFDSIDKIPADSIYRTMCFWKYIYICTTFRWFFLSNQHTHTHTSAKCVTF